jgi:hypothetical protein
MMLNAASSDVYADQILARGGEAKRKGSIGKYPK